MWFKCLQHIHTLKGYTFCLEKVHASFQGNGTLHRFKAGSYYESSNPFERVCYSFKNVRYTSWTIPFIQHDENIGLKSEEKRWKEYNSPFKRGGISLDSRNCQFPKEGRLTIWKGGPWGGIIAFICIYIYIYI